MKIKNIILLELPKLLGFEILLEIIMRRGIEFVELNHKIIQLHK